MGNGIYYSGIYWNDHKIVADHLSSLISGDPGTGWIQHFTQVAGKRFNKVLFLNCGNGWVERDFCKYDLFDEAVGLDCSEELLEQARSLASEEKLPIRYYKVDINDADFVEAGFDLVVNHAAAHHITLIDKVFRKICASLPEDGIFLSYDYVGPHRNQYDINSWQQIWATNKLLPRELRHPRLRYPHYPTMLVIDPTEAVHSELIINTFLRYFRFDKFIPLGGSIAYPLLTHNTAIMEAPGEVTAPWLKFIIDEDVSLLKQQPDSSLFAFFYGKPNKNVLFSQSQLSNWEEEEEARESQVLTKGGRYYTGNVVANLYEEMEAVRAISSQIQSLLGE